MRAQRALPKHKLHHFRPCFCFRQRQLVCAKSTSRSLCHSPLLPSALSPARSTACLTKICPSPPPHYTTTTMITQPHDCGLCVFEQSNMALVLHEGRRRQCALWLCVLLGLGAAGVTAHAHAIVGLPRHASKFATKFQSPCTSPKRMVCEETRMPSMSGCPQCVHPLHCAPPFLAPLLDDGGRCRLWCRGCAHTCFMGCNSPISNARLRALSTSGVDLTTLLLCSQPLFCRAGTGTTARPRNRCTRSGTGGHKEVSLPHRRLQTPQGTPRTLDLRSCSLPVRVKGHLFRDARHNNSARGVADHRRATLQTRHASRAVR